nr:hypothetical protein [Streptomyces africanus]
MQYGPRLQRAVRGFPPGRERRVDVRHAGGERREAGPVEDDVVGALVPEDPVRPQAEHGVGGQRAGEEVRRTVQVGRHPLLGRRAGVLGGAEVGDVHGKVRRVVDVLPGCPALQPEPEPTGLRLAHGVPQRRQEELDVHVTADVHVLGDVVHAAAGFELLGVPDA